jgi:hypothetical protein
MANTGKKTARKSSIERPRVSIMTIGVGLSKTRKPSRKSKSSERKQRGKSDMSRAEYRG